MFPSRNEPHLLPRSLSGVLRPSSPAQGSQPMHQLLGEGLIFQPTCWKGSEVWEVVLNKLSIIKQYQRVGGEACKQTSNGKAVEHNNGEQRNAVKRKKPSQVEPEAAS